MKYDNWSSWLNKYARKPHRVKKQIECQATGVGGSVCKTIDKEETLILVDARVRNSVVTKYPRNVYIGHPMT
jgi:hypothetical protein